MTTNREQEFFNVFGIKTFTCCDEGCITIGFSKNCDLCPCNKRQYPKITSDILLELIRIYSAYETIIVTFPTVKILKNYILKGLITLNKTILNVNRKQEMQTQVRQLFEEVGE